MGLIVVDAGVVIGVLDSADAHHANARMALALAREEGNELVLPASAYAEVMAGALAAGDAAAATVDAFVEALPARIEPITREVAMSAGRLRAEHRARLRLPDALVIATAIVLKADGLLTTDARWPRVSVAVMVV